MVPTTPQLLSDTSRAHLSDVTLAASLYTEMKWVSLDTPKLYKVTDTVASKSVQFLSWGIFEFDPCSNAPYVNNTQIGCVF